MNPNINEEKMEENTTHTVGGIAADQLKSYVERIEKLQRNIIETPLIDISSTEIRSRLAAGGDVCDMVSPAVADYIREHGLYKK